MLAHALRKSLFHANTLFHSKINSLLSVDTRGGLVQAERVKVQMSDEAREAFRACGKRGGKAGDPAKKRASALLRWAKVKASQPASK
jgi:hypothetical protein